MTPPFEREDGGWRQRELDRLRQEREERRIALERQLQQQIDDCEDRIQKLEMQMSRWNGMYIAVVGVGLFLGWLIAQVNGIFNLRGK